jgi:hypothetical protein
VKEARAQATPFAVYAEEDWRPCGFDFHRPSAAGELEKPGKLPVVQATKFELVINMATAKMLGLTISNAMQLRERDRSWSPSPSFAD